MSDLDRALRTYAQLHHDMQVALPVLAEWGRRCNEALGRDLVRLNERYRVALSQVAAERAERSQHRG